MTESEAREEVEREAQTALEPVLDSSDIDAALAKHRRFAAWAASTVIEHGAHVAPTTRNGLRYRAVQGGTTGATEPVWGTTDFSQVSDGSVIWEEDGVAGNEWDVRGAVYQLLSIKLAKAANENQYLNDARGQASSYLFLNLQRLRERYRPVGVA